MTRPVFKTDAPPQASSCLIADSPHSGRDYPADFDYACPLAKLRLAEDAYLDQLLDFLPGIGVPFLQAQFPRAYIDVNRTDDVTAKYKADPAQEYQPAESGLIRAHCAPRCAVPVYGRKLGISEAFNRVASYYAPYHAALKDLVNDTKARAGKAVHVDCHSMPGSAYKDNEHVKYDIILGCWYGATADEALVGKLRDLFAAKGYAVGIDIPGYRGGEVINCAGDPQNNIHSIQLEINRRLYVDEDTLEILPRFAKTKADLQDVFSAFMAVCDNWPNSGGATPKPPGHKI